MKNKFFYNKFLPVLSVFLLVLFTFTNNVFALSSQDVTYSDSLDESMVSWLESFDEYNSGNYYYILGYAYDGVSIPSTRTVSYLLFIEKDYYDTNNIKCYFNNQMTDCDYLFYLKFSDSTYVCHALNGGQVSTSYLHADSSYPFKSLDGCSLSIKSNLPKIYRDDSFDDNNLFFHQTPLGIIQTLVEETERVQIAEQLKMMIAGFLKYLIALVISLIAFWKGWQFLSTQLRKV